VDSQLRTARARRKDAPPTKSNTSQTDRADWLERCAEMRAPREQLKRDTKGVGQEAIDAGCSTVEVAEGLGIGRMTLWRMLNEDRHTGAGMGPSAAPPEPA
jgi:hypothetical protein